MSGKRMDPERLAALYDLVPTTPPGFGLLHLSHADLRELLGDRDHQEAKAKRNEKAHDYWLTEAMRWRSQCPVTAEHVEAAGVSRVLAERWLHLAGVEPYDLMGHSTLWRDAGTLTHACTTSGSAADIAAAISMLADDDPERCAHDILDEMAAATPGGGQ